MAKKEDYKRRIWRTCILCGKRIAITVYKDKHYRGGEFFGKHKIPIEGTGEYKKIDTFKIGNLEGDVVKWTGKEREFEYWECPDCYAEAMYESWLEEKIEELYGERCPDYEPHCALCSAWFLYDQILEDDKEKLEKKQRKYERAKKGTLGNDKEKDNTEGCRHRA